MSTSRLAVCFEQIQGNYWYGAYGEFRVVMMKDCGWVNATKMCASGGKRFENWAANDSSKRLIKALQNFVMQEAHSPSHMHEVSVTGIPVTENLMHSTSKV